MTVDSTALATSLAPGLAEAEFVRGAGPQEYAQSLRHHRGIQLKALRDKSPTGRRVVRLTRLAGGYCNLNFVLELESGERCVLRVSGQGGEVLAIECAVLERLRGRFPVPEVLYFATADGPIGRPYALLSLLPGTPLCCVEDGLEAKEIHRIAQQLGTLAARMHVERFSASGFFAVDGDGALSLSEPMPSMREAYEAHARLCLATPALRRRLGPAMHRALKDRFWGASDMVWSQLDGGRLTHCDFSGWLSALALALLCPLSRSDRNDAGPRPRGSG